MSTVLCYRQFTGKIREDGRSPRILSRALFGAREVENLDFGGENYSRETHHNRCSTVRLSTTPAHD
ncbi:MAG: hypothetical protein ACREQV_14990, partial [Candidatus Binatia bacterium]